MIKSKSRSSTWLSAAFVVAFSSASLSAFACDKPSAPTLPDPDTAITPQMIKAKNDMKDYIDAAEAYLKCVDNNTRKYNDMVNEMQSAADEFNGIVRKYKKRMAG